MSYQAPYAFSIDFQHAGGYVVPPPDEIVFGQPPITTWDEVPEINCTINLDVTAAPQLSDAVSVDFTLDLDVNITFTITESFVIVFDLISAVKARMQLVDISIHLISKTVLNIDLTLFDCYDSVYISSNVLATIDFYIGDVIYGQDTGEMLCYVTGTVTKQIITVEPPILLLPPGYSLDFFSVWCCMENQRKKLIIKINDNLDLTKRLKCVYNKKITNSKKINVSLDFADQQNKKSIFIWQFFDNLFNVNFASIILSTAYFNKNSVIIYDKNQQCESIGYQITYLNPLNLKKSFIVPFTTKAIVDVKSSVVHWGHYTFIEKKYTGVQQQRCYSGNGFIVPFNPPDPPDPNLILVLPTQDCYLMTCTTSVKFYPEMTEFEADNVSLSIDDDSFGWKVSFNLFYPSDAEALIPTIGYKEVLLTVCGHNFLCVIESVTHQETFKGSSYRASGRSISAYLTSPYVSERDYIQSSDLSVVQIAEEELTGFTGWSIDWQSDASFFVPNGTFKYSNKTPLQALKYIAEGVGAFIQTDKLNKIISVISNYPHSPWTWHLQTPDAYIPINVITNESITKKTEPLYERVYCIGENNGILMQVTRQGTAGTILHSQFLHPLICDTAAGIEAGRSILSKRGDNWLHSIEMPLFDVSEQPTLILPGQLIEVQKTDLSSWIGQCRSISIKSSFSGNTSQIIEIEKRNV